MRRKYIIAVLLLLATGVVSTLALGTFSQSLTETLLTEYTLNYDESSATLSNPTTAATSTDNITVTLDVTQSGGEQQVTFVIEACDDTAGTIVLQADGTGATYSYLVTYNDAFEQQVTPTSISAGQDLTFTINTLASHGAITSLRISFVNDGLVAAYDSLVVDVSDA